MNSRLAVTPSERDPFTVSVRLHGYNGQTTLHWGDGAVPMHTLPGRVYKHIFPACGTYMITALDTGGVLIARQQVTITGTLGLDKVFVVDDDAGIRVLFGDVAPDTGVPLYRVEWQDGDLEYAWGVPNRSLRHDAVPGVHTVKLIDTGSGRTESFTVRVAKGPRHDPDFTVHRSGMDPAGMTIYVRLADRVQNRALHVWWDDADGPQMIEHPTPGMEIPHTYNFPGHYMQTVAYAGDTSLGRAKSEATTVPTFTLESDEPSELHAYSARAIEAPLPADDDQLRDPVPGDRWDAGLRGMGFARAPFAALAGWRGHRSSAADRDEEPVASDTTGTEPVEDQDNR